MRNTFPGDMEIDINSIVKDSIIWFSNVNNISKSEVFYFYLKESTQGCLFDKYSKFIGDRSQSLPEILWRITDIISPSVSNLLDLPMLKTRRIVAMIVYFIFNYHDNNIETLPKKHEIITDIDAIIKNNTIKLW